MTRAATVINWEQGAHSQLGARIEQQDRWGLLTTENAGELLAIVADGMGGHQDGALGAQAILEVAQQFITQSLQRLQADPRAALSELCLLMHTEINTRSEAARSTVVMVWLTAAHAYWLNIGDSRLYHFRQSRRLMRTRDHSAVQLLMDLGEINEAQMSTHPAQNRLYRCLGGGEAPKPDVGDFSVQTGDVLVLCSDGGWEHLSESELWEATQQHGPALAAQQLAAAAAQRGGKTADNTTLVLLRAQQSHTEPLSLRARINHWLGRSAT